MVPVNYDWHTGISEMSQAAIGQCTSSLPTWPVENSVKLYQTFVRPNGEFTTRCLTLSSESSGSLIIQVALDIMEVQVDLEQTQEVMEAQVVQVVQVVQVAGYYGRHR